MATLTGKTIAALATDGVEDSELTKPLEALREAGATVEIVSVESGTFEGKNGTSYSVDKLVADVSAADYDGLLLPGGVANPDTLRDDADAVSFVRDCFEAGLPIGAICHGPWLLVEADVVSGLTVTSYSSIKTDLRNAGATWVDAEVQTDHGVTTSRNPDDIPAFNAKVIEEFAEGKHDRSSLPAAAGA
jgi:protease I